MRHVLLPACLMISLLVSCSQSFDDTPDDIMVSEIRARPVADNWEELHKDLHLDPVLAKILATRGVQSASDLDYSFDSLIPMDRLAGLSEAADRLVRAIKNQERILIAGDYDTDGATAIVLCISALEAMGATDVQYAVPDRFKLGYGLSKRFVETLLPRKPDLIVTVDNGISSIDGVTFANENGIDVIITDHHLPPKELPPAAAIVNPQLQDGKFGSQPAGVGVAFYLMLQVRRNLHQAGYFEQNDIAPPNLASYLDLVALGTVVDMVPLDHNNRLLVSRGISRIQKGYTRPGITELCRVSGVDPAEINEENFGFQIGPRLNAAGRLADMGLGIQALLAEDSATALEHAYTLNRINRERQSVQHDMTESVFNSITQQIDPTICGICIYDKNFHEGVVGLVAGKVAQAVRRPTIVFATASSEDPALLKGSARSITGIHIRDALADIATLHPKLIRKFGGHAMAAGLTIHRESFDRFSNIFNTTIKERATAGVFDDIVYTDGELADWHFNTQFVERIDSLGPWGQAFPRPLFQGSFRVINQRLVGDGKHLKLELAYGSRMLDAIAFGQTKLLPTPTVKIAYRPAINNRSSNFQLIVESIENSH